LCLATDSTVFANYGDRVYHRCPHCLLTFLAPECLPDAETERAEYLTHFNHPDDPGYRHLLSHLVEPLLRHLAPGAQGLDYGCGPGPGATLSVMLAEQGFPMAAYDPFFAPDAAVLQARYDFITCGETAEHFHLPARDMDRFDTLLKPDGWLGLMTHWLIDDADFAGWRYRRELSHVCFYKPETLRWIAERYGWGLEFPARNVALFHKPAVAG
jgi:2-polyprenyl-3-methyl-5-hydroxy-6-metoxy-1,4-benzoquinol methylase